jgi:hypothetical protein
MQAISAAAAESIAIATLFYCHADSACSPRLLACCADRGPRGVRVSARPIEVFLLTRQTYGDARFILVQSHFIR